MKRCSETLIREMQIKTTVNITSHLLECLLEEANRASWSGGPVVKNQPCNARDTGSFSGLERSHTVVTTKSPQPN